MVMILSNNPKRDYYSLECPTVFLIGILLIFAILIVGGIYRYHEGQDEIIALKKEVNEAKNNYDILYQEKISGDKTIATLGELVNEQVIEETMKEQELLEASIPSGFPLNGTATIEDYQATDITVFQVNQGICIIASGAGEVTRVEEDEEYGYVVEITHLMGYVSIYRTNESATVAEGQEVERGEILFIMDEVGSFAYQILYNDQLINPLDVMDIAG